MLIVFLVKLFQITESLNWSEEETSRYSLKLVIINTLQNISINRCSWH